MKEIKGAEATIRIEDEEVTKSRDPKKYRHKEIDSRIRKERTSTEYRLIEEAQKYGVNVPEIHRSGESELKMEKIEGSRVRDIIDSDQENLTVDTQELMEDLGSNIAELHSIDIIHGDLTTSNVMATQDEIYLIDFGLAFRSDRIEDKAVDIHLLKQVLASSHPEVKDKSWKGFVEGYKNFGQSEEVLEQLKEVEGRGRYK